MNINRYNYEEYFLLYTDNELNAAEREAVEQFIQLNPDLEQELVLLKGTTLIPEERVVYHYKDLLTHEVTDESFIDASNCEGLFVLYADDELDKIQKSAVEQFVYDNPIYQETFELMQSLRMEQDSSVVFRNKKVLFRHEKNTRPVLFTWWRMAAAAVILLFTGIIWITNSSRLITTTLFTRAEKDPVPVKEQNAQKKNVLPPVSTPPMATTGENNTKPKNMPPAINKNEPVKSILAVKEKNLLPVRRNSLATVKRLAPEITIKEPKKPQDTQVGNIVELEKGSNAIAGEKIRQPEQNSKNLVDLATLNNDNNTGENTPEARFASSVKNEKDENVILTNISLDRKNSLRGLFRKASRIIDKTAALKPAKKTGISIGNIEIAFQ